MKDSLLPQNQVFHQNLLLWQICQNLFLAKDVLLACMLIVAKLHQLHLSGGETQQLVH